MTPSQRFRKLRKMSDELWKIAHPMPCSVMRDSDLHDAAHLLFRAAETVAHPGWDMLVPKGEVTP